MTTLTTHDQTVIDQVDYLLGRYLETIKRAQQFKQGDFLILRISDHEGKANVVTNSYGAPVKYKVVYVDKHGISYIKRTNKHGEPVGQMSSCIGLEDDEYYRGDRTVFAFELDPDYADSILLEDSYDPNNLHRSKKEMWKAVTEHNKAHKIPTKDLAGLITFLNSVNIGDTLWTSHTGSYFIQDRKTINSTEFHKRYLYRGIKVPGTVAILTIRDKNGKVREVGPDFFQYKALYKERPRTYKELNL